MENVYDLYNPLTGASMSCTTKYLGSWLARGFVVERVIVNINKDNIQTYLEGGGRSNGTQSGTANIH